MQVDEAELIAGWQTIQEQTNYSAELLTMRRLWYSAAWTFLRARTEQGHWWCQHTAITAALGEVIAFYSDSTPRIMWEHMAEQLGQCGACINSFHATLVRPLCMLALTFEALNLSLN